MVEHPADLAKLSDSADYLSRHQDKLVILDEIHRVPELFPVLRILIDEGRRVGQRNVEASSSYKGKWIEQEEGEEAEHQRLTRIELLTLKVAPKFVRNLAKPLNLCYLCCLLFKWISVSRVMGLALTCGDW
jgi:hypothetical protein